MTDPRLNNLLKWGIENSDVSRNDPSVQQNPSTNIDPEILRQVMGGPSDADLMRQKMDIITSPEHALEDKVQAFDDFEMLIETIDNANNMENLKLWTKLAEQLDHEDAELRKYAAWCIGTAVENNPQAQQRLLILGAIPTLVKLATEDPSVDVRKKAARALSCASRNFQPALDAVVDNIPSQFKPKEKLNAADMDSVDSLMNPLREDAARIR